MDGWMAWARFQAINPLTVKTKVHLPSLNPLCPKEGSKVLLELHIQNTSPLAMYFPKMTFEPVGGLSFRSMNDGVGGALAPGEVRQVCWVVDESGRVEKAEPGGILPLGLVLFLFLFLFSHPSFVPL